VGKRVVVHAGEVDYHETSSVRRYRKHAETQRRHLALQVEEKARREVSSKAQYIGFASIMSHLFHHFSVVVIVVKSVA
jgi:hypothetical protein